jgi:hypothetical protein
VFISSFSFRWLKRSFAHCFVSLKSCIIFFNKWFFQNRVQIYKPFFFWQVLF